MVMKPVLTLHYLLQNLNECPQKLQKKDKEKEGKDGSSRQCDHNIEEIEQLRASVDFLVDLCDTLSSVRVFRSIDSNSVKGFPKDPKDAISKNKTMQMMYEVIYKALQEVGLDNVYEPQDYLNFFCLGTRESSHSVEPTFEEKGSNSANSPQVIFFFLSFELVWDCRFELEVPDPETMVTFPVVGDEDGAIFVSWTTTS
ncbi:hypothetical protein L2E82_15476 [Cichorium intybus]|uniref:Uncharacterized protein n=1 Tax=Cichorium intybus TaxID=13427 RepID=A0ACB9F291_CICIN|nr:hypothetical protein L2E82_15476 [Cichorium intybus]